MLPDCSAVAALGCLCCPAVVLLVGVPAGSSAALRRAAAGALVLASVGLWCSA